MNEVNFFGNIIEELDSLEHPETHHYRKGTHPGKDWKLKTVCPIPGLKQVDYFEYGIIWKRLSEEYSSVIKLMPYAYDWYGNEIPYMVSVWIDKSTDIIFDFDNKHGLSVNIVDREDGEKKQNEKLRILLSLSIEELINPELEFADTRKCISQLEEIEELLTYMENKLNRKNKKPIKMELIKKKD